MGKVQFQVDGFDANKTSIFNQDVTFDGNINAASISISGSDLSTIYASKSYVDTSVGNISIPPAYIVSVGSNLVVDSYGNLTVDFSSLQPKVANVSDTEIGYLDGVTSSIQTQIDSKLSSLTASTTYAPIASPTFTGTVGGITKSMVGLSNVDNTSDANKPISSATQTALDAKASLSGATFTGNVSGTNLTLSGDLTVNGTTSTVESRTLRVQDNLIYLNQPVIATITNAAGNGSSINFTASNTFSVGDYVVVTGITPSGFNISGSITQVNNNSFKIANTFQGSYVSGGTAYSRVSANPDLGIAGGYNDGTYHHAGLFRDASDSGKWKLFQGYTPEPDAAVDIDTTDSSFALAPLAVSSIEATSATIGNVSNTELQYLDGVTSAIQTQINSKAPIASPTFTGTVTIPSGASISGYLTSATAASTYAPIASPTFTGTVVLPSATSIGTTSSTELGYVKGVTSAIQTQLDSLKITNSSISSDQTLSAKTRYFVDTSAARTLTLPSSPSVGDEIKIFDASGSAATNNITLNSNSNKINGSSQNLIIDINGSAVLLTYTGSTYGWKVQQ